MDICRLGSLLGTGGKSFGRDLQPSIGPIKPFAAGAAIILLLYSTTALSKTARIASERRVTSNEYSMRPRAWDCSVRGQIRNVEFETKGVDQGINEALKVLQDCQSCRDLFGDDDPIALLKQLVRLNAIIVSKTGPATYKQDWLGGPYRITGFGPLSPFPVEAVTLDLFQFLGGHQLKMIAPCIYIDPTSILVRSDSRDGPALARDRALVILHELAHAAGVIPMDYRDSKRSRENSECVQRNCIPCGQQVSPCIEAQKRHSSPRHRRSFKMLQRTGIIRSVDLRVRIWPDRVREGRIRNIAQLAF